MVIRTEKNMWIVLMNKLSRSSSDFVTLCPSNQLFHSRACRLHAHAKVGSHFEFSHGRRVDQIFQRLMSNAGWTLVKLNHHTSCHQLALVDVPRLSIFALQSGF